MPAAARTVVWPLGSYRKRQQAQLIQYLKEKSRAPPFGGAPLVCDQHGLGTLGGSACFPVRFRFCRQREAPAGQSVSST